MAKLTRTRSWPVRANGLLLVLEAAGLGGISAYNVYQVDWQQVQQQAETAASLSPELVEAIRQAATIVLLLGHRRSWHSWRLSASFSCCGWDGC